MSRAPLDRGHPALCPPALAREMARLREEDALRAALAAEPARETWMGEREAEQ